MIIHISIVGKKLIKNHRCMLELIPRCRRTQIILHNYINAIIVALECKRAWNWINFNKIKIEYQLLNWIQIKMRMMIMMLTMKKIMMAITMTMTTIIKVSCKIMISWVKKQSYKSQRVLYQSQILMKMVMTIIKLALIVLKIDR